MKNLKKMVAIGAIVGMIGTTGAVVYAATTQTPAQITAGLTGKTAEQVYSEHQEGKTYGAIAKEAGKLDEFKSQMLEQKKSILDEKVEEGKITKERADEIYNAILKNQENCDGTGNAGLSMKKGAGFGSGSCGAGNSQGNGAGRGMGYGSKIGAGRGMNK